MADLMNGEGRRKVSQLSVWVTVVLTIASALVWSHYTLHTSDARIEQRVVDLAANVGGLQDEVRVRTRDRYTARDAARDQAITQRQIDHLGARLDRLEAARSP